MNTTPNPLSTLMLSTRITRGSLVLACAWLGACQSDSPLAPNGTVPDRLSIASARSSTLASFGDSVTVQPRVLDAGGNAIASVPLVYSVSQGSVLEALGNGTFRARGNGTAVIRVAVDPAATGARPTGYFANRLTDSVVVTVQQQAARIVPATFDSTYSMLGLTRTILLQVSDARGNPITTGTTPVWESTSPDIAGVDSTGRVRSRANGTARVSVRVGNASWGTTVTVNATRTHVSCMRYLKRRQQQQQCVTNVVTMWAPGERAP